MKLADKIKRRNLVKESRELLNKINDWDGEKCRYSDAELSEFRTRYNEVVNRITDLDTKDLQNDIENHTTEDEARELNGVIAQAGLGEVFQAVIEKRAVNGAAAELQQHYRLTGHDIPLAMLRTESRAVTPAPANIARNQSEIVPAVFPQSMAAFLHVQTPTVDVGDRVYPVITKSAEVKSPAAAATAAETTGAFAATNLEPKRLQASFFYNREDRSSFAGMDMALRQNLSDALSDALDAKVIAGLIAGGTVSDLTGAVATYKNFTADMCYGAVDGRYANTAMDIRIAMGSETYGLAANTFANTTTPIAPTALDRMIAASGGVQVGANVPALASKKQKAIIRRGMAMDAVAPIWEGVTLINDEVTKADTGQIVITAVMMYDFAVLRKDGILVPELQLTA